MKGPVLAKAGTGTPLSMGKLDLAVKDYDEALRLKPDYQAAQRNKAEAEAALSKKD